MRKPKLFARFRHSHLIPLVGFRVDLQESRKEFGKISESVCFEVIKATEKKLTVRLYCMVYDKNKGEHTPESYDIYEVDLTKPYNERNVKFIKNEYRKDKK